jgi:hypothetical protein
MHKINQLAIFEKAKQLPQRQVAVAAYRGEAHMLSLLYFMLGLCIAGYVYFVGVSILNLIANREAFAESERLQSEVAMLETEYFELGRGITAAAAAQHGLTQPVGTSFVRAQTGFAANVAQDDI